MGAMLDSDDALTRHEWLIAPLLLQGSHSRMRVSCRRFAVEIDALTRACPQLLQQSDTVEWDDAQGTLKAFRRSQIGKLTLGTKPLAKPSEDELHQAMLNGNREKRAERPELDAGSGAVPHSALCREVEVATGIRLACGG